MRILILSYFDLKAGPKVFLQTPELLNDEELSQISRLLDLHSEGFFAHIFKNFKSVNYAFDIPNENFRGNKTILQISIVVDINSSINLNLSRELLEGFAEEMNKIEDIHKGLFVDSPHYEGDYNKFNEIKNLLLIFNKSFKPAMQALKEAELRYQTLFKAARDAILIINRKSGIVVDANDETEKLFERPRGKIIGLNSIHLQLNCEGENLTHQFLKGVQLKDDTPFLAQITNSTGKIKTVEVFGNEIKIGDQHLIQFILHDITERLSYEKELKESEEKYRNLVNNISDTIGELDLSGKFTYVSPQVSDQFGYEPEELIGRKTLKLIHPDDLLMLTENLTKAFRSKDKMSAEYRILHKNGNFIPISLRGSFVNINNEDKFLGIIRDITERKKAEQKLKESEERYRLISENANDLIVILNENFEYEYINELVHKRLMGYSKEDVIGRSALNFLHPDDIKEAAQALKKSFEKGEGIGEVRIRNKKGDYIWLEVKGKTFIDKDKNKKALIISRDITERKKAEQKLKESEERYRLISENAHDLIAVLDDKLNREYINEHAYKNIFGYSKDFIINQNILRTVHPNDLKRVAESFRKGFKIGEFVEELRVKHKDGHWIWLETKGKTFVAKDGRKKIILISRDMTERIEADIKIKESEKKYRHLFESSQFMIVLLSTDGKIIDFNPAAYNYIKYKKDELIGKDFREMNFIPDVDLKELKKIYKVLFNKGYYNPREFKIYRPIDNELTWIYLQASLVNLKDETLIQVIIQDITERKKAEQESKESEEKYRLAYNRSDFYKDLIAHDMKNVLQAINSAVELYLIPQKIDEEFKNKSKLSNFIKEQLYRGNKLISNTVKLSELEDYELTVKSIEVVNRLNTALELVKKSFPGKNIDIDVDIVKGKLFVKANELLLDLFENILINGIYHNQNPRVEINIKISKEQKNNISYLRIEFVDNGLGISDDRKEKIFQKAYDGERRTRGRGIGLSLVKQIIESYKGQIWVENRVKDDYNKGSNFIVLIPATS